MTIPSDASSFAELNDYISRLFQYRDSSLLLTINESFSKFYLDILLKNNWKLYFGDIENYEGLTDSNKKIITIKRNLDPYSRDKAICHELIHAQRGENLDDLNRGIQGLRNNAIVEWNARRIRASPTLLSLIWKTFDIPPRIYDRASLLATKELVKPQLLFPSLERDYNFTLMD
ncbi:hypothetical protein J4429_05600 [Candidatus Pacearchaeota archaeon]|nr:hypothetical protein [Candidatus Pacearchaeota archaeon]